MIDRAPGLPATGANICMGDIIYVGARDGSIPWVITGMHWSGLTLVVTITTKKMGGTLGVSSTLRHVEGNTFAVLRANGKDGIRTEFHFWDGPEKTMVVLTNELGDGEGVSDWIRDLIGKGAHAHA